MRPYRETVKGSLGRPGAGNESFLCVENTPVQVWKPKWDKHLKLKTIVRITGPSQDGIQLLPYRNSGEANDFTEFVVSLPLWTGGTAKELTFIGAYADPDSPGDILDPRLHPTPATMFADTLWRTCQEKPELDARLKTMRGNPRLKTWGLVQGILLKRGAVDYAGRPRMPIMMQLSWSAKQALESLLNKEKEGYVNPDNYEERFETGDIVHADTGKTVSFFNAAASETVESGPSDKAPNWDQAGKNSGQGAETSKILPHYGCEEEYEMPLPREADGSLKFYKEGQLFTPWGNLLRFFEPHDMAQLVIMACEDMPEILMAAFHAHPEWLPKYMKGDAVVQHPGNVPAPAAAPQAAPQAAPPVPAQPAAPDVNWGGAGAGSDGEPSSVPEQLPFMAAAVNVGKAPAASETVGAPAPAAGVTAVTPQGDSVAAAMSKLTALGGQQG